MSLDSDISILKRIPLFSELTTEQLRLLAFSAVRLDLRADQVLFREGTKAMSGFIVAGGGLELTIGTGEQKRVVTTCETGCLIGEVALFIETRRPATATAMVSTQVLEIDRKMISRMLNEYPNVAQRLHATLSERLSATIGELSRVERALADLDRSPARR